ncbi:thiamine phosphate synthase [Anaerosacchariphilus polymeriproducens]|uniref:Thiamine-phosphate synthase n=1 Tax=Anaerosacchariphilus polymeriproducens TaxID=1812858 RepID=A0A371ASU8_9FIRM|nr:thiamine phosphate synthase [Anaerosacchariphilus polymeriproducens]RDU22612.1 thiamine phosphate synthase [Anaerosacchariphilus polymeriproducens]
MKRKGILYLIADFSRGEQVIEQALKAGVDYVQLREKNISSAEYLRRAKRMKQMTDAYHTPLLINDRIDIAMIIGAEGVHLGQDDIPVSEARRILGPGVIIGATAKTVEQALDAQKQGADYLGSGAWFLSNTKQNAIPIKEETYVNILENSSIPNVAVGGIQVDNCHIPLKSGADGLAISAGILASTNIHDAVMGFRIQLGEK